MNEIQILFKSPKLISCSVKYVLIICFLTGARFTAWYSFILNWTYSKTVGTVLQIAWFAVIELIIIQVTSAFAYMLLHNKMKFKRFFSFMHFKYFKFNFLITITYALFFGGCTFVVNYFRFSISKEHFDRVRVYIFALFLLILNAFKLIFAYFRAENANGNLKSITKSFFDFLAKNIKETALFIIKFIPWIVGYIFLIMAFNKTDFEMVVYVMLNSCLYGLGIFFFPCCILGLHKLARPTKDQYKTQPLL